MSQTATTQFSYGLSQVQAHLLRVAALAERVEPNAQGRIDYTAIALDSNRPAGRLSIVSGRQDNGGLQRSITWSKQAGPREYWRTQALIRESNDALGTPTDWQFVTRRHRGSAQTGGGDVIDGTSVARSFRIVDGKLQAKAGGNTTAFPLNGPHLVLWQLFSLVQRAPRDLAWSADFALVDQFDQPKPRHRLFYTGVSQAAFANGKRQLHGYAHVGTGIVPWTYWVDDATNRLLTVVAGVEAYVIDSDREPRAEEGQR